MTTLAPRAALRGPGNGGVAARRAVIRWAGRMFRREWRRQVLVVALLTVAVAAAVGSVTLVHNASPADDGEFGSASQLLRFDAGDPRKLAEGLASAKRAFGTTEVIGHRSLAVPGSVETVDVRDQDPHGVFGSGLLALRQGRYPAGPLEVAVTDGVAKQLGLKVGETLSLEGLRRTVVGIVENPRKLSDEFALVSPSSAPAAQHVSVLVDASSAAVDSFIRRRDGSALVGAENRPHQQGADTLAMFSVATVFLLLASLVAAAGFAVVAQRRLRQLGMLAAVGATPRHVRLVLLAHGAIVGAVAALLGTLLGLGLWVAVAPVLESGVDHRIDRLSLPWGVIGLTLLVAVVGAIAAAWWPARTVARVPVVLALSGRPPKPRPARHAAIAAAVLLAAGIACLALSGRDRPPLIIVGIVATILGCLLLGPPAIRIFSGVAGRLSIAPRLALRDLVRYQARSGAALAAVTLALGIAVTIVIVASAEQAKRAGEPPNLSDRSVRVYTGPSDGPELISPQAIEHPERMAAGTRQIAAQLDRATVMPVQRVLQPGEKPIVATGGGGVQGYPPLDLMSRHPGPMYQPEAQLFVATPAMLRYLGIDPASVDPRTDYLVDRSVAVSRLVIPSFKDRRDSAIANVQRIDVGAHALGSFGGMDPRKLAFITLDGLRRHGWKQIPAGWLVQSSRPLTSAQIAAARAAAAKSGLAIEVRKEAPSFARGMALAIAAGALLALGILAMTVGLIRGEGAADLRTLTATGAGPRIRRTLTATTSGALALLGALLGVAGAYIMLIALYHDDLGYLSDVPVLYLVLAVAGVPVAAAAAGWLLAGREPPAIARTALE